MSADADSVLTWEQHAKQFVVRDDVKTVSVPAAVADSRGMYAYAQPDSATASEKRRLAAIDEARSVWSATNGEIARITAAGSNLPALQTDMPLPPSHKSKDEVYRKEYTLARAYAISVWEATKSADLDVVQLVCSDRLRLDSLLLVYDTLHTLQVLARRLCEVFEVFRRGFVDYTTDDEVPRSFASEPTKPCALSMAAFQNKIVAVRERTIFHSLLCSARNTFEQTQAEYASFSTQADRLKAADAVSPFSKHVQKLKGETEAEWRQKYGAGNPFTTAEIEYNRGVKTLVDILTLAEGLQLKAVLWQEWTDCLLAYNTMYPTPPTSAIGESMIAEISMAFYNSGFSLL